MSIVRLSEMVNVMIPEDLTDAIEDIPLPNVNRETLVRIVQYLGYHNVVAPSNIRKPLRGTNLAANGVGQWDLEFIDLPFSDLRALVEAANYMMIQPLFELGAAKIASEISGKSRAEMLQYFGIFEEDVNMSNEAYAQMLDYFAQF